ncbi:hypothetical protein JTE90_019327 [Oedothorax gibbosus]|uniref:No mechanoreceptor potential C n=1 Tax=Oedothorax gibbosus TaxID=931172 RepID=A0AAV6UM11_9ARAC|nr:hypothetical protein JTE90_019327 [Oedothorax gibbosus]
MPGLPSGNEDKPPQVPKDGLPSGRIINTTLPSNRPLPPGLDNNQENVGGNTYQPRLPPSLNVPLGGDPPVPPFPRSPLRTIIAPPNAPTAIGRPAAQRLLNNGITTNGIQDLNGNGNSDPTTVVHTNGVNPPAKRTSTPISSQQVTAKNVQPGVLANTQRVGIQAISVVNGHDSGTKYEETVTNGVSNPKRTQLVNGQEKVFTKTPNALKREEAKKEGSEDPSKTGKNTPPENGKNGELKNGKDKNGNGKPGSLANSPTKKPLGTNGNGKNGSLANSPTKKPLGTNGNGKNGSLANSPTKKPLGTNGNGKNGATTSPTKRPLKTNGTNSTNKSDEKASPVKQSSPLKRPQESESPTRKITSNLTNGSPTKKTVPKQPKGSPSPTRKKATKSPLPSPKTARKNVLNTTSPAKPLGKPGLALVPGRPMPATATLVSSQPPTMENVAKDDNKDAPTAPGVAKASDGEKTEKGTEKKSEATIILDRLLALCRRGDWLAVETLLNHLDGLQVPTDLVDKEMGYTPLMYSVKDNRVFVAERFLDMGMDINIKGKEGFTALHLSAQQVREDMVRLLLGRKADPMAAGGPKGQLPLHIVCSRGTGQALTPLQLLLKATGKDARLVKDKTGNIPLMLAVEVGNHGICRELLMVDAKEQLSVRRPDIRDTPLHIASRRRDIDLMRMLIEKGAAVNLQNSEGMTPLHLAAMEGDEGMLKVLSQANARANILDRRDRAPVHLAAERGHTNAVEILLDKFKASISQRTKDGSTLMHIASAAGFPDIAMIFMKRGVPIHTSNKSGAKCLHIAAAAGHVEVVRSLLNKGESVDIKTNDGFTALHIAVQGCQPRVVETLLGYGAQIRLKAGKSGETPLHIAARTPGGEKCAELLLKSGGEVNATQEEGETALHFAARHGHLNTVALLLQDKADVQQKSNSGETPLHVAARNCHYAVARSLLDHWKKTHPGDNGATLVNAQNELGETVLHYASLVSKSQAHHPTEDKDLVKLLLQYGGEVNIPSEKYRMTSIHYCAKEGNADILHEILNQIDPTMLQGACNRIALNGWTPLLYACQTGHPEVVKLLLQNSARVDVFDENGKAALHLAAEFGHGEVVDILLKHKAFANARNKKGMTPLHLAAKNGYTEIVQKLVSQYGATLDALTLTKRTPLHLAAENGKLDVCQILLEMRADANAIDNTGQTPLLLAAENDHPEVVKLFLRHKPELVSMANANGFTCAHIAAMKGSVAVIKELMKFNRSMVTSARNLTGNTSLHLASSHGHAEVVKVLLEAGSSATEENADGFTALHLAAKDGHVKVLQTLKSSVSWRVCSKKTGMTALHVAASCGQTEFVQEMLTQIPATIPSERPGDTSLSDDYGFTPLHLAAESGHEGVVRVLLNSSGVQTDAATVVQGTLPMHLAARGGHLAVAGLLLSRSTEQLQTADKQGRTPLHMASAQGHREMVGLLLGQGADINVADNEGWTALHYTTRHGFLDVVQLLVNSGASPTAATKDGKVPLCLAASAGHYDVLNYLLKKEHDTHVLMSDSNFLIDLMVSSKAHANKPVLEFVLVSAAPIETAAKMARSYQLLSLKEKDRARDLEVMAIFCEAMAADLLGITAISYNTGTLLRSVDSANQPFLDVLIELQQKEVVAHPAVQKYLTDLWMGSLTWASWKMSLMFMSFLVCPLVWIAFSLPLGHRFTSIPIIKFMSYLVSHIFFIALLTFTIVNPWLPLWNSTHLIPYIHEWLLLLWLIGLWVSDATNPKDREGLGFIKVIIMTVGSMGILTHVFAFVFPDDHSILVCLYIRNQFLAVALLLCFVEFLNFLTFHHLFGPWTVIIRDLIKDLMRFLAILGIFLVGFSLHLCAIYQPVFLPQGADNLTLVVFQSPIDTFEMLFFALFGLVEPDFMPPMHLSPSFSKGIMKVVFGIYMMVTVIVLINLLIAMMSNTYQRIQAQSDTEWKFGRAKLIRNMNKTSPSPSPICLFTLFGELFYRCPKKVTGMKPQLHLMKAKRDAAVQRGDVPKIMPAKWQRRCTTRSQQIMPVVQNLTAGKPIAKVVDWPAVVLKYLEVTGTDIKMELQEDTHPGD